MKLQEEILSAKEYIQNLKSALTIFTDISSIQTAIYETEASIIIYDGVIVRRIQEAETDAATSRKERSYSATRDSRRTSSSDVFSKELEDEDRHLLLFLGHLHVRTLVSLISSLSSGQQ